MIKRLEAEDSAPLLAPAEHDTRVREEEVHEEHDDSSTDRADGPPSDERGIDGPMADREPEDPGEVAPVPIFPKHPTDDDKLRLRTIVEAVLFASTEPLTATRLAEVTAAPVGFVKEAIADLAASLDEDVRPYELREHGGGFRLYTRPEFYPFLLRLRTLKKVEKLTPAALETLAIVAYRQPVIRAEVEAIRGVRAGPLLRALLDRKLIRVTGRADVPGAPLQYGTTARFLDRFGLASLADLPSLKEFQQGRI